MRVLVVNAGSSSLKLRLLDRDDALLADHELPAGRDGFDGEAAARLLRGLDRIDAIGHRFVHGGPRLTAAVRLEDDVERYLRSLVDLAPLHQPPALAGAALTRRLLPGVPAVACLDTAFHAGMPAGAATYALPREWRERHGIRRYGFHGLSHAYAARRTAELLEQPAGELRVVTSHLGAGASLAAVRAGVSVDTTMGFTPLEGVVMATRPGSIDPGIPLWLQRHAGVPEPDLSDALEHRSGLLALAGSADMREVLRAAAAGDVDARLGLDVYVHRLRAATAAMAAAMDGLDALTFTGGVGEHAAEVRAAVAAGLGFLGVAVDAGRNAAVSGDAEVTAAGGRVRVLVVRAREDLEIARQVREVLRPG
ncbi:MAG TPA: acetate/propionate family kinase [Candidatus Dormibacteraeota bacterium]|nr:acetate/propionate family kinase [Candidatus Dormibacteraeota bacterium]